MRQPLRIISRIAVLIALGVACAPAGPTPRAEEPAPAAAGPRPAAGPTRVTVGVTETIESPNPYAHTDALKYGLWAEAYGALVRQDFDTGGYAGILAESWAVENPTTWVFHLRKNAYWSDGSPVTAADVLHSYDRLANDPATRQRSVMAPLAGIEARDPHTVVITTKEPLSPLMDYVKDRVVTNKASFDQYGDGVYTEMPVSAGPYMFKELVPDQYLVLVKNPNYWRGPVQGPDEVVYRVMRENEVRVTALLNNEIQIAQFIPPHMAGRVAGHPNTRIVPYDGIEMMFLAMRPDSPPWDNNLVRQAVGYAIDRDAIIQGVLQGDAVRLDGPIGRGRYGYDPDLQPKYPYNPERARQLLAQAGYPNGVDVELYTPVGRYTQDKQVTEAMAQMLTAVGIRTRLMTPEWPTLWDNVMRGRVPFYYMGRIIFDPDNVRTYVQWGDTPRVGYHNPVVEELFVRERGTFDPLERAKVIAQLNSVLLEDAPLQFLWVHKVLTGMTNNIEHQPRPDDRIFPTEIHVR